MKKLKILFVCHSAQNRSPTASEMYNNIFDTEAMGLYKNAQFDLHDELETKLKWCDRAFVMEEELETVIRRHFPNLAIEKKITNLDIPDVYVIDEPALKLKIEEKMKPYIEELRSHQINEC